MNKKIAIISALIALTASVGCSVSCSTTIESHSSDAGTMDAGSWQSSQLRQTPTFENAITTKEIIIYSNE